MDLYAESEDCCSIPVCITNPDDNKMFEKDGELQPVYCEECYNKK